MDEIRESPENAQQLDQPQIDESPKEHGRIRKIFNTSSWFVFFALLPATVLILLSQNTIPGDLFYPIKRGMESVVLAAATVNPATRVAFRTDLTERRFDEAEKLLLARADVTGLSEFVEEVQTAQQEVSTLSNLASKKELTEKLIKKIDEYQNKLVQIQSKTQVNPVVPLLLTNTIAPTLSQSEQTPILDSQITSVPKQNPTLSPFTKLSPTKVPTDISFPTPTSAQQIISPKPTSIKTSVVPTTQPTPTQTQPTEVRIEPTIEPNPRNDADDDVESAIDDTQERLEEIKKRLKDKHKEKKEDRKNKEKNRSQRDDH